MSDTLLNEMHELAEEWNRPDIVEMYYDYTPEQLIVQLAKVSAEVATEKAIKAIQKEYVRRGERGGPLE